MTGKNKCRILKQIRREIAKQNNIEFVTEECKYKGECLGTCPKCEAEVRYLERELEKKKALGKKIAVAGLAIGMAATSTGCTLTEKIISINSGGIFPTEQSEVLEGDIAVELAGEPAPIEIETDVLQGKFYPEETTQIVTDGFVTLPETEEETSTETNDETQIPETTSKIDEVVLMGDPVVNYNDR